MSSKVSIITDNKALLDARTTLDHAYYNEKLLTAIVHAQGEVFVPYEAVGVAHGWDIVQEAGEDGVTLKVVPRR